MSFVPAPGVRIHDERHRDSTVLFREIQCDTDHERVVECIDLDAGYHGIIAVHSTVLGPAVGGTRLLPYASQADALEDALRLSRAMSYKAALAGLPFGGGKAVIIGDTRTADREQIFRAHGRFIDRLGGEFITGEDVGTRPADMALTRTETVYAAGTVDPAPATAHGVFQAILAAIAHRLGADDVRGLRVVLQGYGSVGQHLGRELRDTGASLVVGDLDASRAQQAITECGAAVVDASEIYDAGGELFAPCALGGVLNDATIPRIRARLVVGAANNQLLARHHADALRARGILCVPDYVASAGGIIHGAQEICGWTARRSAEAIDGIYDTTRNVLLRAGEEDITPAEAADRIAMEVLGA